jgi:hypothetical protein
LALVFSVGCAQVSLSPSTSVCTDYAFGDEDAEQFLVQADTDGDGYGDSESLTAGSDIVVSHLGVFMGCEDVFAPEISANGRNIVVREFWNDQTDADCSLCFAPSVTLESAPASRFTVSWYEGYADDASAELEFRVD